MNTIRTALCWAAVLLGIALASNIGWIGSERAQTWLLLTLCLYAATLSLTRRPSCRLGRAQ